MKKIWFITGAANGLGRDLTEEALLRGDSVAATARRPAELFDLSDRYGEAILPLALDVRDETAAVEAVEKAVAYFGRLDVVVNNAGYAAMVPFEDMAPESFEDQMNTNFYGAVYVTRAALPHLRRQRSGHILQISSVGDRAATPGLTAYQSAKWAISGFSGVLAGEVEHLGIKVTVVESGSMKTNWAHRAMDTPMHVSEAYEESVGELVRTRHSNLANLPSSDPKRVAKILADVVDHDDPPLKLLIGSDAVNVARRVAETLRAGDDAWEAVSRSSDSDADGYAPLPR
jgi:NAD(P)-dependent dehydrogenase (short-subunit alcohol dehydrogenase family)